MKKLGCRGCTIRFLAGVGFVFIAVPVLIGIISGLYARFSPYQFFWLASGSMEPTMHGTPNESEADKYIIDTSFYRSQLPERGDIIRFNPTENLLKEQFVNPFVSRIVGLPGEKIQLRLDHIFINNQQLTEAYLAPKVTTNIDVCQSSDLKYLNQPQTIPADSYVVMGDNRNRSDDSRCWGTVPKSKIIGKVIKIIK